MKILRLRAYCFPEVVATSAMNEDIDAEFEKQGFLSINYTPVPSRGISDEVRIEYKHKKSETFRNGHVIVHRFPMVRFRTNILHKAIRTLICSEMEYFMGIKEKDVDLLFGYSNPFQWTLNVRVAKTLSRKYGRKVPVVYCLQDVFPDSLVNAGITKKGSLLWKIGRRIEDRSYRGADKIIVISEDFKKNIMAKGVPEDKIVVISNWGDTDNIYPVERKNNTLFDSFNLDRNKFYISYGGTIGYSQNMDLLLDAAKEIKAELPDVRFALIAEGAMKSEVEQRIRNESIDNVIVIPYQPYEKMAEVFSLRGRRPYYLQARGRRCRRSEQNLEYYGCRKTSPCLF